MKKDESIQLKYFRAVLLAVMIPMLVLPIFGYIYSSNLLRDKLTQSTEQSLDNVEMGMNHIVDDVISASNVIALDEDIKKLLEQPIGDYKKELMIVEETEKKLHYMEASNMFDYMVKTILIDFNGRVYDTGEISDYDYDNIVVESWFDEAVERRGFFIWQAPSDDILGLGEGMSLIRLIQDDYNHPLGVLVIHLFPESRPREVIGLKNDFEGSLQILLNQDGQVIMTSDGDITTELINKINSITLNGGKTESVKLDDSTVFISERILDKTDWKLVQITPYDSVMSEVVVYRNLMIWINVIFAGLLLLAVYFVTSGITKNIKTMNQTMNEVTKGNLNIRMEVSGSREVNQVRDNFNYMVEQINHLIKEVEIETEKRQKIKLEALQAQINPHFLLNTLNGIKLLCVIESAPTAEKMLVSLGYLLENTLGKYNDFVTLNQEIECLRNYVKLQKMRYGNTFTVTYNIEKSAELVRVPVLLLQPIVENSILHAFDEQDEPGEITIDAIVRENYLEIWVSDNGKGMDEKLIEHMLRESPRKGKYSKMGIKNVKERIELYYKPPCGLGIDSTIGVGTKTVLLIASKDELNEVEI